MPYPGNDIKPNQHNRADRSSLVDKCRAIVLCQNLPGYRQNEVITYYFKAASSDDDTYLLAVGKRRLLSDQVSPSST